MNYYSTIPLLAFIASVFISALILGKGMRKTSHRAFLVFSLALQAWAVIDFITWNLEAGSRSLALIKIQSISWLPSGFLFLNFIYAFLDRKRDRLFKVMEVLVIGSLALTLFTGMVVHDHEVTYWGVRIVPGPLFFPVVGVVVLPFVFSLYLLCISLFKTKDVLVRQQLVLLSIGTLAAVAVGLVTDVLLPYFMDIDVPSLSSTASVFQSVLIFVAVTRYRFMSIGIPEVAQKLFYNVSDAVIIMNSSGKVVNCNPAANKMIGEDAFCLSLEKVIENYHPKTTYDSFETAVKVSSGMKTVLLTQSPVRELGSVAGWILIMKDITAKKEMELELIDMNKELDTFVYKASHDLKGPLASIRGLITLAREGVEDRASLSYINMIEKTTSRMDKVLLDLLQVTKIKKSDMQPCRIMLKKLTDEILESLQYHPGYNNVSIEVYCSEDACLYSDLNSVSSVLQNLVQNGINYRNPEAFASWLDIIINTSERGAEIMISDNGIGIPEDQQEKVFEMFHRASSRADGTGLGLYIVKTAVARLGGTLRMESKLDTGTTFCIFIPNAGREEEISSVSGESKLSLTGAA